MIRHIKSNGLFAIVNGVICSSEAELQYVLNTYTLPSRWTVISRGAEFIVLGDDAGGSGEIFLPAYQGILDYATLVGAVLPSSIWQTKGNALVAELQDTGIWDLLDIFVPFYTDGDLAFAEINWVDPGGVNSPVRVASPTFTPLQGAGRQGLGIQWDMPPLNSGYANYSLNNGSIFGQFNQSAGGVASAALAGPFVFPNGIQLVSESGVIRGALNSGEYAFINSNNVYSFIQVQRPDALSMQGFSNGDLMQSAPIASVSIATDRPSIFWTTYNPLASARMEVYGLGGSLTGKELQLYNAWETYKA